jgi:hypothetical protein
MRSPAEEAQMTALARIAKQNGLDALTPQQRSMLGADPFAAEWTRQQAEELGRRNPDVQERIRLFGWRPERDLAGDVEGGAGLAAQLNKGVAGVEQKLRTDVAKVMRDGMERLAASFTKGADDAFKQFLGQQQIQRILNFLGVKGN